MAMIERLGFYSAEEVAVFVADPVAVELAGTFQPIGDYATETITRNAGAALSGQTAVYISTADNMAYPAVPDSTARYCIGITTEAAAMGAPVKIKVQGVFQEPSWAWSPGTPVWLASAGGLTQTLPTTGALFQVGTPFGPTALRIGPQIIALLP